LHGMAEKDEFRLDVYGTVWDASRIRQVVSEVGLTGHVRLHGFVDALDDALATADFVINLRHPTMGEASGTQLRIWDHALPSVVADVGWYRTLPKSAVIHIPVEDEMEALRATFRRLLTEPATYKRIGENGRAVLDSQHSPEQYAEAIVQIASEAMAFRSVRAALLLAERAGRCSAEWTTDERVNAMVFEKVAGNIGIMTRRRING
jgi:glycosyltransferase involved in cell wall biosynthesis